VTFSHDTYRGRNAAPTIFITAAMPLPHGTSIAPHYLLIALPLFFIPENPLEYWLPVFYQ
jgi:hypothetical protein